MAIQLAITRCMTSQNLAPMRRIMSAIGACHPDIQFLRCAAGGSYCRSGKSSTVGNIPSEPSPPKAKRNQLYDQTSPSPAFNYWPAKKCKRNYSCNWENYNTRMQLSLQLLKHFTVSTSSQSLLIAMEGEFIASSPIGTYRLHVQGLWLSGQVLK
jgi:hypothetical protein